MDTERRKRIIDDAYAFTLDVFRRRALSADEGFCFERVFGSMESFFCEEILSAAEKEGLSQHDCHNLFFGGWDERKKALREECHAELLKIQKERAVKKILAATVESTIEPGVRKIGLPYRLEYQKYRVKVVLRVDYSQVFEFYVRYRDMDNKELMSHLTERTRGVIEYIKMFGPQVRVRGNSSDGDWRFPEGYNKFF